MNENWKITYHYLDGEETNIYTANGILDAIQQLSEMGISICDIIKMEIDE